MSVIEFFIAYWDWYLLIGLICMFVDIMNESYHPMTWLAAIIFWPAKLLSVWVDKQ